MRSSILLLGLVAGCAAGGAEVFGTPSPTEALSTPTTPPVTSPTDTDGEVATTPTDTAPPYDPLCNGDGDGTVALGTGGGVANFVPLDDGDALTIVKGPTSDRYGLTLDVLTTGLDTTEGMSAILRVEAGGDRSLFNGILKLQCPVPGPGWVSFHADFESQYQAAIEAGAWDGEPALLAFTVVDHTNEKVEFRADVVLRGP